MISVSRGYFAVKFIGQSDGAVELTIIVDHRRDVAEMARAIDIFGFDKSEKTGGTLIVQ